MSDQRIDELSNKFDNFERRSDKRYDTQLEFNKQMLEATHSIEKALVKMDTFHVEMNALARRFDNVEVKTESNASEIAKIREETRVNHVLVDELRWWKKMIVGGFAAVIIGALATMVVPSNSKSDKMIEQQTQVLKLMAEKLNDNSKNN